MLDDDGAGGSGFSIGLFAAEHHKWRLNKKPFQQVFVLPFHLPLLFSSTSDDVPVGISCSTFAVSN